MAGVAQVAGNTNLRNTLPSGNAGAVGATYGDQGDAQRNAVRPSISSSAAGLDRFVATNQPEKGTAVPDRSNTIFSQWPVRMTSADPYDETVAIRQQTIKPAQGGAVPVVPGMGVAMVGDEYFNWVNRKQEVYQYGKFKSWLLAQIDMSSPEKAAYWKEKAPQIFEERRELFMQQQKLTERLAKIQMLGPEDLEDFQLIWMIQEGMITLPSGPAWAPKSMPNQPDFVRGMFSVKRIAPELVTGTGVGGRISTSLIPWSSPLQPSNTNAVLPFFQNQGAGGDFFGNLQGFVRGNTVAGRI